MEPFFVVYRGTGLQFLNANGNWTKSRVRAVHFKTEAEAWVASERFMFGVGVEKVYVEEGSAEFVRIPKSTV